MLILASSDFRESQESCPSHGFSSGPEAFPLFFMVAQTSVDLEILENVCWEWWRRFAGIQSIHLRKEVQEFVFFTMMAVGVSELVLS